MTVQFVRPIEIPEQINLDDASTFELKILHGLPETPYSLEYVIALRVKSGSELDWVTITPSENSSTIYLNPLA